MAGPFAADSHYGPFEIKSKHETVFSVFLLALAFLFRNHPSIRYPEILWVFVAFLAFNFLYNRFLKQAARDAHLAFSPIFINGILITWAVHYSGGPASYLWVMYLLPVFTACLLFDRRGIVLSTFYVLVLHASIYGDELWSMDGLDGLQFLSRTALLVMSSSLTARLAYAEREAQSVALAQRRSFEDSLDRLWGRSSPAGNGRGGDQPQESLLSGGIHDVNTALSIILGSTQLLLMQGREEHPSREDLGRIESAVRLGKVILQNLFLLGRAKVDWPLRSGSVNDILREAVEQCRTEVKSKGLTLDSRLEARKDEVLVNGHLLHQAFVNFLFAALTSTPSGGKLKVFSFPGEGDRLEVLIEDGGSPQDAEARRRFFDPSWMTVGRGKGVGLGLYLAKEIVARHGGEAAIEPMEGGAGNRVRIKLPLCRDKKGESVVRLEDLVSHV